jgi:hypothetical protein
MLGGEGRGLMTIRETPEVVLPSHLTLKRPFCQIRVTLEFREIIRV